VLLVLVLVLPLLCVVAGIGEIWYRSRWSEQKIATLGRRSRPRARLRHTYRTCDARSRRSAQRSAVRTRTRRAGQPLSEQRRPRLQHHSFLELDESRRQGHCIERPEVNRLEGRRSNLFSGASRRSAVDGQQPPERPAQRQAHVRHRQPRRRAERHFGRGRSRRGRDPRFGRARRGLVSSGGEAIALFDREE